MNNLGVVNNMWFLMIVWFIIWEILSHQLSLDFSFCNHWWFTMILTLIGYFFIIRWAHLKYRVLDYLRGIK